MLVKEQPSSSTSLARFCLVISAAVGMAMALLLTGFDQSTVQAAPLEDSITITVSTIETFSDTQPGEWVVEDHLDETLILTATKTGATTFGYLSNVEGYTKTSPGPTIRMGGDEMLKVKVVNGFPINDEEDWYNNHPSSPRDCVRPDGPISEIIPLPLSAIIEGNNFLMKDIDLSVSGIITYPGTNTPVLCLLDGSDVVTSTIKDWELPQHVNGDHQKYTTNLHTHGLHVEPGINPDGTHSDNVLLRIIPKDDYDKRLNTGVNWPLRANEAAHFANYEFRLGIKTGVETHYPGTYWYHPHGHGSTEAQVQGGMAGFLIVEGDVDDVIEGVSEEAAVAYHERLLLYQTRGTGAISALVNGILLTTTHPLNMVTTPGAIEHWRLLNGSATGRGFIDFMVAEATLEEDGTYTVDTNDPLPISLLSYDGVTLVDPESGLYTTRSVTSTELAPANRSDFLFQAPENNSGGPRIFVLLAKQLETTIDAPKGEVKVFATLTVESGDGSSQNLLEEIKEGLGVLEVPRVLRPIESTELQLTQSEVNTRPNAEPGMYRTRVLTYAGWGSRSVPFPDPAADYNTMSINGQKFNMDGYKPLMGLGTTEEWTLWNMSMTIYTTTASMGYENPYLYGNTLTSSEINSKETKVKIKASDHVFHMHQNPFWVTSVIDGNGNPLFEGELPRWQDSVRMPRNGGRVIFQSRFPDFTGDFVNHCHLLMHEDWGMMQAVSVLPPMHLDKANYTPATELAEIKPANFKENVRPQPSIMYKQNTILDGIEPPACDTLDPPPPNEGECYLP